MEFEWFLAYLKQCTQAGQSDKPNDKARLLLHGRAFDRFRCWYFIPPIGDEQRTRRSPSVSNRLRGGGLRCTGIQATAKLSENEGEKSLESFDSDPSCLRCQIANTDLRWAKMLACMSLWTPQMKERANRVHNTLLILLRTAGLMSPYGYIHLRIEDLDRETRVESVVLMSVVSREITGKVLTKHAELRFDRKCPRSAAGWAADSRKG